MADNDALADALRRSVMGGRKEGAATKTIDALGGIPKQVLAAALGMVDAAKRAGASGTMMADDPLGVPLAAETAMNLVGIPGLTGGVPVDALGSALRRGSRNRMVENADESRQAALERRNEGRGSTNKVYATTDQLEKARGGGPARGTIEYDIAEFVARLANTRKDSVDAVRRALFPEPTVNVYHGPATNPAELMARHNDPDAFF
jgi:hypothetical protein